MRKESEAAQLREELDRSLRRFRRHRIPRPFKGWICQIREALGMTISELGHRMNVTASTVSSLQESERRGTIEIETLKRVAGALDCRLFYILVPNSPLSRIVASRRRMIASAEMAHACKGLSQPERLSMLPDWAKMIKRNRVWKEIPRMSVTQLVEEALSGVTSSKAKKMADALVAKMAKETKAVDLHKIKEWKAEAVSTPVAEPTAITKELNAARKRLAELEAIPREKRTAANAKEWSKLAVFIDENEAKEPWSPEEEARCKRLNDLDRKGLSNLTVEEKKEYSELSGTELRNEGEDRVEDEATDDSDNGGSESGDKTDGAKDDEENEKERKAGDKGPRDEPDESNKGPNLPMTMAKVALVLGAGLKGAKQPESKAGDASEPKPDAGGPRIRML